MASHAPVPRCPAVPAWSMQTGGVDAVALTDGLVWIRSALARPSEEHQANQPHAHPIPPMTAFWRVTKPIRSCVFSLP